jgi:hypothetical protein
MSHSYALTGPAAVVTAGALENATRRHRTYRSEKRKMMLRALICAGMLAAPVAAFAFTGGELSQICSRTDIASRIECKAYIEGAADGVYNTIDAIGGTTGPRVGQYFCLPADTKAQSMVDAVRKYIAENPRAAEYNASTVVSLGLGKTFPCKLRD